MKPGLRKIAALILASTTLFSGGALSASTALADDLTVDSSTQVQADTNQNTTTDDNGSGTTSDTTGDTTTQTQSDVHADTSVRAQSAPEAAKDVTIHDMLDTDTAYVSKLKLTDRVTGTAPFDNDNERGDDKDASNDIVRSFDSVIYDYDYTVTPDSTMDYYKRTRVGFRFELPYPADKVTFDTDQMGWVDQTPSYQPKLTTETVNGVQTQVYTCYRLLEPTSNSPTVNPGTSAISLAVAVKGAPHGYKFHPTVKAWTAWDASNPTNTGTHKQAENTPQDITVSAKLNLNVRLGNFGKNDAGVYDFNTDQKEAPFANIGKVTGYLHSITSTVEVRWPDRSKGMKGLEMPTGKISYHIHVQNAYKDDKSNAKEKPLEERWQPYFYADNDGGNCGIIQRNVVNLDNGTSPNCAAAVTTNAVKKGDNEYKVARTKTGLDIQVTFDGYDTSKFPSANANNGPYNNAYAYLDSSKKIQQVGPIHVNQFRFVVPTEYNGKTVSKIYGVDQISHNTITEGGLQASTATEDKISDENDSNAGQSITNDDTARVTSPVRMYGWFSQKIRYSTMNSWVADDHGMSGHWKNPDSDNGSDIVLAGSTVGVQLGYQVNLSDNETTPVTGMTLGKFDPSVLGPATEDSSESDIGFLTWGARIKMDSTTGNKAPRFWGVKKDGTTWKSDDEQRKATIKDLNFYPTLSEAKQHGVIVAVLVYEQSSIDPENSSLGCNFFLGTKTPMTVRDDAVGKVAQITADTYVWTRKDLTKLSGLSIDDDNVKWAQWVGNYKSPLDLYKDMSNPSDTNSSESYTKSTFDENGVYQGGDTADTLKGDSLFVTAEIPHISKSTEQTDDTGENHKNIYDLDKEQRYADWLLTATADTGKNSTGETYTTDYRIKDVVPKGLTYVDGSSYIGGTYKENNKGQERGTVTGGTPVAPKVTKNDDGTTTLEWVVTNVQADSSTKTLLHYSTTIGDVSDPDNDAKNNQQYANHVEIRSKRAMGTPLSTRGQKADYTIRVSRTHSSALATRAQPLLNDVEKPLGFTNMLGNFSKDEKKNPYAVDIMPYSGAGSLSKYSGGYVMTGLNMGVKNGASLDNVRVYFTTDPKWRTVDATKITREQVEQWTEAKVDRNTGTVTIPDGCDKPVSWAFTSDKLPANARYDFSFAFKPSGNKAADAYVNRWTDGDNKVDAVTQVVERRVNGVAWFDNNHNGVRESTDRLLAGVNVTLLNKNGKTVTSVNGKPCTTVTDQNGHYELSAIPGGSGFKLRFTPKTGTTWRGQHVTVKNAKEASEATDSDSDEEDDSNGNMVAGVIRLKDFPALDKMTAAVYEDPNEDHGIYGMVMPTVPATFKAVKVLNGRPNGAWTDKDKYVADITPLDNAPKSAMPASITFTDNRTKTVKINSGAFPTDGVYRYQVKERRGDNAGVAYDSRTWILTVTVTDDLTTFKRHVTVNAACDGVQSDTIQFTNTYAPKDTQARIVASKLFTNADKSATKITDFQFDLYANNKATGTPIQTVNATADGKVEFSPLLFTKAKLNGKDKATFSYSVRERNTGAAGVKYDDHYAVWTVTVTDDNSGQLKASLINPAISMKNGETIDNGQFVNSYSSHPVSVTPKASKVIDNPKHTLRLLNANEFTFELQDTNGKTIQSKANNVDGTVTFDKLAYNTVGEHDYRIVEKTGQLKGITYDQTVHTMHVNVTDNGYGQLKASTSYDNTSKTPVFLNTYQPKDVTVSLTAHKTFDNKNASHAKLTDFQFQLFNNEKAVGVPVQTVNADRNGDIRFQPLTFTASQLKGNKSKTFTYTVREIRQSAGGVNYDSHMGMWQITVTDDLTGQLKAQTRTNAAYPTTFTNTYQAKPVSVQFRAHKTLNDPDHTGIQLQAGQYEFKCVEDKTGGQAGTVKTNDQQGNILFDTISYKKTGVYDYTLSEVHGDRGGVTYDATKHHVKVTVTDNGEGQLLADVKYDNGTNIPEFTNTYHAQPATDNPTAVKKMTSSKGNKYTLKGEDFAFTLQQQSAPANVSNADQTKRNDRQGNIRFDQLSFPLVGTYVFTMSEQDTTVPGVTKDGTVATITYVVKDVDHTGKLTVVSKTVTPTTGADGKNITFTNHYSPKNVGYSISGVKNIVNTDTATSRTPQDGEFKFQLNAVSARDADGNAISVNDMPMPAGSQNGTQTVSNKGSGFTFGQMVYTMPGAYTYHVKELAGTDKTIGYSTQEYDVTVTVTDQNGALTATSDRQTNDIRFDNTYTPTPVSVQLEADKHLTGRDLNDNEFTAELKDSNGNLLQSKQFIRVPRDAQSDKEQNVREGDGTLEFDKLTFDKTGVYTYTVDEQDGTLGGVTYDTTSHTVTITVTEDSKSHKLVASVAYSNGKASEKSILFQNTYQPEDVLVELSAKKNLTGRELQADEFEFELVDDKGNVIDSEKNDKQGNIQFKPFTYGRDNDGVDDCGEYRYVIREKNTGEKNVTYDKTEHHVTVTVSDNLQGNLTAKVQYDPTDDSAKDSSTMLVTPTDKADKTDGDAGEDENNPTTTPSMVITTGTRPEFTNSYIPPATPAIVKAVRQLAQTGVNTPIMAVILFTLVGMGLMLARRRGNTTVTARHKK
jgi:pilin isopeptide linkage protein